MIWDACCECSNLCACVFMLGEISQLFFFRRSLEKTCKCTGSGIHAWILGLSMTLCQACECDQIQGKEDKKNGPCLNILQLSKNEIWQLNQMLGARLFIFFTFFYLIFFSHCSYNKTDFSPSRKEELRRKMTWTEGGGGYPPPPPAQPPKVFTPVKLTEKGLHTFAF